MLHYALRLSQVEREEVEEDQEYTALFWSGVKLKRKTGRGRGREVGEDESRLLHFDKRCVRLKWKRVRSRRNENAALWLAFVSG